MVSVLRNQSHSSSLRTKKPTLQSDDLSPDRPWTMYPKGALVVGPHEPAGTGEAVS